MYNGYVNEWSRIIYYVLVILRLEETDANYNTILN